MRYYVYVLSDPRTDIVYYVGITNNPDVRMAQHVYSLKSTRAKDNWVRQLLSEGVKPEMRILQGRNDREYILCREKYWIQYYLVRGAPLLNTQNIKPNPAVYNYG